MLKDFVISSLFIAVLSVSSDGTCGYVKPVSEASEYSFFSQELRYDAPNSVFLLKNIDSEIDGLDTSEYDDVSIINNFIASAEQLKKLIAKSDIGIVPDISLFPKGFLGLVWNTKSDEDIFLYSLPNGKLFYNRVWNNGNEMRHINADKDSFNAVISEINKMA